MRVLRAKHATHATAIGWEIRLMLVIMRPIKVDLTTNKGYDLTAVAVI